MLYHSLFILSLLNLSFTVLKLAFMLKLSLFGLSLASFPRAYSRTPCVVLGLAEYLSYSFLLLSEEEPEQDFGEDGAED